MKGRMRKRRRTMAVATFRTRARWASDFYKDTGTADKSLKDNTVASDVLVCDA